MALEKEVCSKWSLDVGREGVSFSLALSHISLIPNWNRTGLTGFIRHRRRRRRRSCCPIPSAPQEKKREVRRQRTSASSDNWMARSFEG